MYLQSDTCKQNWEEHEHIFQFSLQVSTIFLHPVTFNTCLELYFLKFYNPGFFLKSSIGALWRGQVGAPRFLSS